MARLDIHENRVHRAALLGMLCALGIVSRIAMSALPNIQPVTAIIILTAAYIGMLDAAMLTAGIVLATNMYLGMGMWTLWQLLAWCVIALVSRLLFARRKNAWGLLVWAIASGYIYSAVISAGTFSMTFAGGQVGGYLTYWLSGLLFDSYHAVGNGVFIWFLLPLFKRICDKK